MREILGLVVSVNIRNSTNGGITGIISFGTLNYDTFPNAQFRILPIPLDMELLNLFSQLFRYGDLGSLNPKRVFLPLLDALKLVEGWEDIR